MKLLHCLAVSLLTVGIISSCQKEAGSITEPVAASMSKENKHLEEAAISQANILISEELADRLAGAAEDGVISGDKLPGLFTATKAGGIGITGIRKMERVFPDAGEWEPRHREAGLHRWYRVTYSQDIPRTKASGDLGNLPGVEIVEFPHRLKMCDVKLPFNDPYAAESQWHLFNDGSLVNGFVNGCDINVVPVWKDYTGGSSEVIVAIVDDGIQINHQDLKGVVIPAGENGSKNFVRYNYNIVAGDHGTHVAGLVGAINNNHIGTCGVAGGLDGKGGVRLLSCQIFEDDPDDPGYQYSGNAEDAIVWAADHGAVICQNSWGYQYSTMSQAKDDEIGPGLKMAVDYFIKHAGTDLYGNQTGPMKGGVVFFAAGNDGWPYGVPGNYSEVIAVGATGPDGLRASYSNYGDWVDICAPGGEMDRFRGPGIPDGYPFILSLAANNKYMYACGTSMSCPLVSGVAALIVSQLGGEGFTNEDLKKILLESGSYNVISKDQRIGPMVDAYAAISSNDVSRPVFNTDYDGNFKFATCENASVGYIISDEIDDDCDISLESDGSAVLENAADNRCTIRFVSDERYVGSHTAVLKAENYKRKASTLKIYYTIYVNQAPVVRLGTDQKSELLWFETSTMQCTVSDPEDGSNVSIEISSEPEGLASFEKNGSTVTVSFGKGDGAYAGECSFTLTASDRFGEAASASYRFSVLPNRAPIIISDPQDILFTSTEGKQVIRGKDYFYDPDGEMMTYTCTAVDESIVKVSIVEDEYYLRPMKDGVTELTIEARDGLGMKCTRSFKAGVYDDSKGPTVFPNPVKDNLNIRIGAEDTVSLTITSEMGTTVFETSMKTSIFNPMSVNLTSLAPGRYTATIVCGGKKYVKKIVKL